MSNALTRVVGAIGKSALSALPGGIVLTAIADPGKRRVAGKVASNIIKSDLVNATVEKLTSGALSTKGQTKPNSNSIPNYGAAGGAKSIGTDQHSTRNTAVGVKFNLPPHKWSLPLDQESLSIDVTAKDSSIKHSTRRATMWCYGSGSVDTNSYSWGNSTDTSLPINQVKLLDTNWGFQFLWNPDKIANSLSRNANFTPTAVDRLSGLFGLFTAMEGLTFNIVIDRVNDFACIKSISGPLNYESIASSYYTAGYPNNPENAAEQVKRLSEIGTMADVEYIFKMINGEGSDGIVWKNALGRQTADLGFLSPTAVAVQFGPNLDSLSYVGYVDGITVAHNMFTEDMIPIHSEVTVSFVAFSRTSLSQK